MAGGRLDILSMLPGEWEAPVRAHIAEAGEGAEVEKLQSFLESLDPAAVVPERRLWFRPLHNLSPEKVCVIVLGQDPYPTPGHSNGYSFAVNKGVVIPRTLRNIMKVARACVSIERRSERAWPMDRTLENWKRQGVLLLNMRLTTSAGESNAHANKGWETITRAIMAVAARSSPLCIALLWGDEARKEGGFLKSCGAELYAANDPRHKGWSREMRGDPFSASRCFYHANARRRMKGLSPIRWDV